MYQLYFIDELVWINKNNDFLPSGTFDGCLRLFYQVNHSRSLRGLKRIYWIEAWSPTAFRVKERNFARNFCETLQIGWVKLSVLWYLLRYSQCYHLILILIIFDPGNRCFLMNSFIEVAYVNNLCSIGLVIKTTNWIFCRFCELLFEIIIFLEKMRLFYFT